MSFQNPLARAKGLGSAHDGVHHWWWQKITAIMLLPLLAYLPISLALQSDFSREAMQAWLAQPLISIAVISLLLSGFYHMWLGLQMIIEDYISNRAWEVSLLIIARSICWLGGIAAVLAIVKNILSIV